MGKAIFNPGNPVLVAALLGFDVTDQIEADLRTSKVEWLAPDLTPRHWVEAIEVAVTTGSRIAAWKSLPNATPEQIAAFSFPPKPDGPSAGGQFWYGGKCAELAPLPALAADRLWNAPGQRLPEHAFEEESDNPRGLVARIQDAFRKAGLELKIRRGHKTVWFTTE